MGYIKKQILKKELIMDLLNLMEKRHSVRAYSNEKVSKEMVDRIVKAGVLAPTACNFQPVRIIVIQSDRALEKLSSAANFYNAPLVFAVLSKKDEAWHRPFDGMVSDKIDASFVTDHMMLEATELGLGSVWICYFNPMAIKEALEIENGYEVINLLAVGFEDENSKVPAKKRKDILSLVKHI